MTPSLPRLLVSVRSTAEARAALAGGADLIDIKEPARGPMGSADAATIEAIIAEVAGRVPVSAAFGEWGDWQPHPIPVGLSFAKWGMARLTEPPMLAVGRIRLAADKAKAVAVAYADFERAQSPDPDLLAWDACDMGVPAFLIDTSVKDGSTLLDWMSPITLERICRRLAFKSIAVALAGSLNEERIRELLPLNPDFFGVRGAACIGGRAGMISAERVQSLKALIAG